MNDLPPTEYVVHYRIKYCDTDQMGIYYHARALEWFEFGRNEALRTMGKPYCEWEAAGLHLPLVEAHLDCVGRAVYDDLLRIVTTVSLLSRTRIRCDCRVEHAQSGEPVCRGWTVHVLTNHDGRPIRPPHWVKQLLGKPE